MPRALPVRRSSATACELDAAPRRLRIRVRGAVQGVGFRPFVYRLAQRHGLSGFVCNDAEGVLIEIEGPRSDDFLAQLRDDAPPLARITAVASVVIRTEGDDGFAIRSSRGGPARTTPLADVASCDACLAELFDPASRFHAYPFVTCSRCGPRFSITRSLPYDRACTALSGFPPCAACASDYADPGSRRFHTEAIACPRCGPQLSHPPEAMVVVLRQGGIVALKGVGGFHLLCDAGNHAAVAELRWRKQRPERPFAVMAADMDAVARIAAVTPVETALLRTPARPIVLVRGRDTLSPAVSPGLCSLGVMLPYAPVHHLLFHALGRSCTALVATSGNRSGEPLAADDDEAWALAGIADLVVTHDRPIIQRADDSVMAVIGGAAVFLRRSRGFVPEPIDLGDDGPSVLAVGAHLKASVTVTRGREAFVSQHIGDLDRTTTRRFHQEATRHLLALLDVKPEAVACDLHPDYGSTRLAEGSGLPVIRTQHHAAHVAAVAAEHGLAGPLLGVALDGHGHGPRGEAWGGELLRLDGASWQRLGHLAPLPLPGGDRAAREPWRMAVAALSVLGRLDEVAALFPDIASAQPLARMLATAEIPATTSLGRLFDAAAALLGVRSWQSYEGQAAMELEALVGVPACHPGGYAIRDNVLDFTPLLSVLTECTLRDGADLFHGTLIAGLVDWIGRAAMATGLRQVALGGGCLANRILAEGIAAGLAGRGLRPLLPRLVPAGDGGLSLGQAALARHRLLA